MNIFYLDNNPSLCAKYHHDKHVVKMILESTQMLCAAIHLTPGLPTPPYKLTHANHPCNIWVRSSQANWVWLQALIHHLNIEFIQRFSGVDHKSAVVAQALTCPNLPKNAYQPPPLVMPQGYHTPGDVIGSYRHFYALSKAPHNTWSPPSTPPAWLTQYS